MRKGSERAKEQAYRYAIRLGYGRERERERLKHTIIKSLLSARLAQITPRMYKPRMVDINTSTATFSARLPKLLKTASKSIGFGATKRSLPKEVRCVQRHTILSLLVPKATCQKYTIIILSWVFTAFINCDYS